MYNYRGDKNLTKQRKGGEKKLKKLGMIKTHPDVAYNLLMLWSLLQKQMQQETYD